MKTVVLSAILGLFLCSIPTHLLASVNGLLRVHPDNPLYFTDDSGKAIYLSGHQIFVDLQDNTFDKALIYGNQTVLDWAWYIQFLKSRNLNYVRSWSEFTTGSASGVPRATPMPYERVEGSGNALDGLLKFDLTRFDQGFFDRMRSRALDLQNHGIYISIMLFEVYAFNRDVGYDNWRGNVFNAANNVNSIDADVDGDGDGIDFFFYPTPELTALQEAYVRKVIDTVADLDNVIFEVGNEIGFGSPVTWHYNMVNLIHSYEATKAKQHLVLLSGAGPSAISRDETINGPAPVFAVSSEWADFVNDVPVNTAGKPGIMDTDHIGAGRRLPILPWKALTRGYHYNLYDQPFEQPSFESAEWELLRKNVGATVAYSVKFQDLSKMRPSSMLSSTQYALANPGVEYLIVQPHGGHFTVDLKAGTYDYEWFDPQTATTTERTSLNAVAGQNTFTAPFGGSAVLYLSISERLVSSTPSVSDVVFNIPAVAPGQSFIATFPAYLFGLFTYFDVTFRVPGSFTDHVALNWQRGARAAHVVPIETLPGMWTLTGVRAHENPLDHSGEFIPISRSLMVTSSSASASPQCD